MMLSRPILVFDMDDTLFEEMSFVRSGLAAVAKAMHDQLSLPRTTLEETFLEAVAEDRNAVFDRSYGRLGVHRKTLVQRSIRIYRTHQPRLRLFPAAERCLERFKSYKRFVVTDGNVTAQRGKARALGLYERMEKVYLTHAHGRANAKPSPYCFERIRLKTACRSRDIVYIGDNPAKDFKGIRPLGYATIRVLTGTHANMQVPVPDDAEVTIPDLDALTPELLDAFSQ